MPYTNHTFKMVKMQKLLSQKGIWAEPDSSSRHNWLANQAVQVSINVENVRKFDKLGNGQSGAVTNCERRWEFSNEGGFSWNMCWWESRIVTEVTVLLLGSFSPEKLAVRLTKGLGGTSWEP